MTIVYRITCASTIAGANAVNNVFHVNVKGSVTTADQSAILVPFKAFYDAFSIDRANATQVAVGFKQLVFDTADWVKPTFDADGKQLTPGHFSSPQDIGTGTILNSTSGTGGVQGPPQLAICVSWRTALASRSTRGRTYLGNIGVSLTGQANISPTTLGRVGPAATNLISGLHAVASSAGIPDLCVWSPKFGTVEPILSAAVDNVWDTIRSRVK